MQVDREEKRCPICQKPHEIWPDDPTDRHKCDRCGRFRSGFEFQLKAQTFDTTDRTALAGYVRHRNLDGDEPVLTTEIYPGLITLAPRRISDKGLALLEAI